VARNSAQARLAHYYYVIFSSISHEMLMCLWYRGEEAYSYFLFTNSSAVKKSQMEMPEICHSTEISADFDVVTTEKNKTLKIQAKWRGLIIDETWKMKWNLKWRTAMKAVEKKWSLNLYGLFIWLFNVKKCGYEVTSICNRIIHCSWPSIGSDSCSELQSWLTTLWEKWRGYSAVASVPGSYSCL